MVYSISRKGWINMPAKQLSITVNPRVYDEFEELRLQMGLEERSRAIEEAMRMWIRNSTNRLIAEGCKDSQAEDRVIARGTRKKALKALSRG